MIIGIDHITYSSMDFDKDVQLFINKGYELEFKDYNINNALVKKNFLQNYKDTQSIALLKKKDSVKLEVIQDTNRQEGISIMNPLNYNSDGNNLHINNIEINVYNPEIFIKEWCNYGFKLIDESRLIFKHFGKNNACLTVYIHKCAELKSYYLDNKEYVCLALISTSIERDHMYYKSQGMFVSEIEDVYLINNTKKIKVFFLRGSNNEIIEIIGVR